MSVLDVNSCLQEHNPTLLSDPEGKHQEAGLGWGTEESDTFFVTRGAEVI